MTRATPLIFAVLLVSALASDAVACGGRGAGAGAGCGQAGAGCGQAGAGCGQTGAGEALAGHAKKARAKGTIPRLTRWPLLSGWLRGTPIEHPGPTMSPAYDEDELERVGAELFGMYCRNCHGDEGRGDGPRSPVFDPPPRDLTRGVYKFRSTLTGDLPTPEDLFRTITAGLRGTGMIAFADLPEEHRWALVAHLTSLSDRFTEEALAEPAPIPAPPAPIESLVEQGRKAYVTLECGKCHGDGGRGDGPSAGELVDALGRPTRPRDFVTQPFKRGDSPRDLFITLRTGLDGTPMAAYEASRAEDLWAVVAWVRSLRGGHRASDTDMKEALALVRGQHEQGVHAVVGGCGCSAKRR